MLVRAGRVPAARSVNAPKTTGAEDAEKRKAVFCAPGVDPSPRAGQRLDARRGGTFAPFLRASERPIAMACFRLVTLRPLRPLLSVPRFLRRIADATVLCDFLLYRRVPLRVPLAMGASLLGSGAVAAGNQAASMPAGADARVPSATPLTRSIRDPTGRARACRGSAGCRASSG